MVCCKLAYYLTSTCVPDVLAAGNIVHLSLASAVNVATLRRIVDASLQGRCRGPS